MRCVHASLSIGAPFPKATRGHARTLKADAKPSRSSSNFIRLLRVIRGPLVFCSIRHSSFARISRVSHGKEVTVYAASSFHCVLAIEGLVICRAPPHMRRNFQIFFLEIILPYIRCFKHKNHPQKRYSGSGTNYMTETNCMKKSRHCGVFLFEHLQCR